MFLAAPGDRLVRPVHVLGDRRDDGVDLQCALALDVLVVMLAGEDDVGCILMRLLVADRTGSRSGRRRQRKRHSLATCNLGEPPALTGGVCR